MPISKLKKVYIYLNVYILIFKYDESIKRNDGLLNDLLVKADYEIIMDEKEYVSVMKIIKETTKYFNKKHIYDCYLTQGDPNVLNIGRKPIFFDFETAGYNSILAEIATFIWSILFADLYFAPKYHKNSFKNHEAIFDKNIKIDIVK